MVKKDKIDEELYKRASINDLILFALFVLEEEEKEASFERLTKKCFQLFPKVFALSDQQKWPDTRKLDRPLRALRNYGFITGSPQSIFKLTQKGKKRALKITEDFRQGKLL
ncbi:MAG: hypothetical protein GF370_00165 [Candidatus Nealsonbacteria bacterium]|nr:hypothetical protein [Candidatus Nealsonbacteria bacterium]